MKNFKLLKPGMSFIEVVAALAILAMFGTSLFLMQAYLFDRIIVAQRRLFANLHMQTELISYQTEILKEFFAHKGPVEESLKEKNKSFERPDMTVTIKTRSDFKETILKDYHDLYLIKVHALHEEQDYGTLYAFTYIPKVPKK